MEGALGHGRAPAVCRPALGGEQMTAVCREFEISRKTGYKLFKGYKAHGLEALCYRSRR